MDAGVKMRTKKDPQRFATGPLWGVIIREILCASYFRRYQKVVNVFFKTNTLSEIFVTLSAERCPFSA